VSKTAILDFTKKYGVLLGLGGVIAFFAFESPNYFFTASNFVVISKQSAVNILLALGEMFAILTAGIDLSVGSVAALAGAFFAGTTLAAGGNIFFGALAGLGIGAAFGLLNGILVTGGKLPPFIGTLATMSIARGLVLMYTHGRPIWGLPESFSYIGQGSFLGIPVSIIIMVIAFILVWITLGLTRFGRNVYATGGNIRAARAAGIKIKSVLITVYVISAFFAALGGMVLTSRLGTAQPNAGTGYELDAIASVVLGGTSLFGGEGWVVGTIIGGFLIAVLNNGMTIINISPYTQEVVKGIVIVLAVLLTTFEKEYWNE